MLNIRHACWKGLDQSGISVVDVGVASNKWPAATKSEIEQYVRYAQQGNHGDSDNLG